MHILVIDNYDSFTFNLVHYLEALGATVTVWRNDSFDLDEVEAFDKIVLSPGPGIPDEAGHLKSVIRKFAPTKDILGVCLGLQAIGEVFGGELENLETVYHGIATEIKIVASDDRLFANLPAHFEVGRYHSWTVSNRNLPPDLEITAVDEKGRIMALHHRYFNVRGVQFHPESVLTPHGKTILKNWLHPGTNHLD